MVLKSERRSGQERIPDFKDFAPTGYDTLAGDYMRCFWQPGYRAKDLLVGHTKPIRIMSEEITLHRTESGAPHVLAFRRAHRVTPTIPQLTY